MADFSNAESSSDLLIPRGAAVTANQAPIAVLRGARRIWTVGAIHGDIARLRSLGDKLLPLFEPGDRLVFLGNYLGYGTSISETIDELLRMRRAFLARRPFVHIEDIVFLRGCQEEMFRCLLELQFAVDPARVFEWAVGRGAGPTIGAYGGDQNAGLACARDGPRADDPLDRWVARRAAPA